MKQQGWQAGDRLDITSHFKNNGREETREAACFLAVPYDIPRGCVATYFPEANVLVPIGSVALRSNTPTSKAIVVSLARSIVDRSEKSNSTDVVPIASTFSS